MPSCVRCTCFGFFFLRTMFRKICFGINSIWFAIEIEYIDQKSSPQMEETKEHSNKNEGTCRKSNSHEDENGRSRKIDDKLLMENVHKNVFGSDVENFFLCFDYQSLSAPRLVVCVCGLVQVCPTPFFPNNIEKLT